MSSKKISGALSRRKWEQCNGALNKVMAFDVIPKVLDIFYI